MSDDACAVTLFSAIISCYSDIIVFYLKLELRVEYNSRGECGEFQRVATNTSIIASKLFVSLQYSSKQLKRVEKKTLHFSTDPIFLFLREINVGNAVLRTSVNLSANRAAVYFNLPVAFFSTVNHYCSTFYRAAPADNWASTKSIRVLFVSHGIAFVLRV